MQPLEIPEDTSAKMKARLRADLRTAMKERRATEVKALRALIAALDNAEAPSVDHEQTVQLPHDFYEGSAEVERLLLSQSHVLDLLLTEINEREQSAIELERVGQTDRAEDLRLEAQVIRCYLE